MDFLKQIFNKQTAHGRAIRTGLQAVVALVSFIGGILAVPGLGQLLADNDVMTFSSFTVWVGIITYTQNALEEMLAESK